MTIREMINEIENAEDKMYPIEDLHIKEGLADMAKQIEDELQYPGQIKVNIIRESRAIDYAK